MDSAPWNKISACSHLTVKPTLWKQKQQLRSLWNTVHITCMAFIQTFMSILGTCSIQRAASIKISVQPITKTFRLNK